MGLAVTRAIIVLQGVQTVFILLHDWVPLGRLSNLKAVQDADSRGKLAWTTLLSTLPFALVFGVSCAYWSAARWPMWLQTWLWWTYGIALAGVFWAKSLLPRGECGGPMRISFEGRGGYLSAKAMAIGSTGYARSGR